MCAALDFILALRWSSIGNTLEPAGHQASYVADRMKDHGILISTDGPLHNVLKIKPPMVFTQENADYLVTCLDKILQEDFCIV